MKNVALHNLGCKVNSYEIEVMQQMLQEKGYNIVPFDEIADIYIVNTCTVTNIADRKSRQMLHRAKQKNPNAVVVAVGCYVQTGGEAIEKDDSIDLAIGNNRKKDIVSILEAYLLQRDRHAAGKTLTQRGSAEEAALQETAAGKTLAQKGSAEEAALQETVAGKTLTQRGSAEEAALQETAAGKTLAQKGSAEETCLDKTLGGTTIPDINHTYEYEEMQLGQTAEHTRAYIKIQDGCNQFCSYCAIPYARGRVRSRRAEDILAEVRTMAARGYQEIVLTGIHISSYGIDFDGEQWRQGRSVKALRSGSGGEDVCPRPDYAGESRLIDLVERLHGESGIRRIRLGSLEPRIITEETAKRLAVLPKVCPHFHLSLQSGCDATLRRMNRHYTAGEYYAAVEQLRRVFRNPAITTDVIVGFPGETEEEFEQTRQFLAKVGFYEMHIFKYSKRAGTVAAGMPGQVPEPLKAARSRELSELEKRQSEEFRAKYIGQEAEVLSEESRRINGHTYLLGHTADYVRIAVKTEEAGADRLLNTMMRVKVSGFLTDEILLAEEPTA